MERRERNPDTGECIVQGGGIFDVFKNTGSKLASKLRGKTDKKPATKANEKLIEKGSEKVGKKKQGSLSVTKFIISSVINQQMKQKVIKSSIFSSKRMQNNIKSAMINMFM